MEAQQQLVPSRRKTARPRGTVPRGASSSLSPCNTAGAQTSSDKATVLVSQAHAHEPGTGCCQVTRSRQEEKAFCPSAWHVLPPTCRVISEALDSGTHCHWALRTLRPLCRPVSRHRAQSPRSHACTPGPALSSRLWSGKRTGPCLKGPGRRSSLPFPAVAGAARGTLTSRCSWRACGRRCQAAPAALPGPGGSASPGP